MTHQLVKRKLIKKLIALILQKKKNYLTSKTVIFLTNQVLFNVIDSLGADMIYIYHNVKSKLIWQWCVLFKFNKKNILWCRKLN